MGPGTPLDELINEHALDVHHSHAASSSNEEEPSVGSSQPSLNDRTQACAAGCGFQVHPNKDFGGFCCAKCAWRHVNSADCKKRHGPMCESILASPGAAIALPAPPSWLFDE